MNFVFFLEQSCTIFNCFFDFSSLIDPIDYILTGVGEGAAPRVSGANCKCLLEKYSGNAASASAWRIPECSGECWLHIGAFLELKWSFYQRSLMVVVDEGDAIMRKSQDEPFPHPKWNLARQSVPERLIKSKSSSDWVKRTIKCCKNLLSDWMIPG